MQEPKKFNSTKSSASFINSDDKTMIKKKFNYHTDLDWFPIQILSFKKQAHSQYDQENV